jgi:hypothetical protein
MLLLVLRDERPIAAADHHHQLQMADGSRMMASRAPTTATRRQPRKRLSWV